MELNLSNAQIAGELDLNESDLHQMASQLREGVDEKRPVVVLSGQVEADELYVRPQRSTQSGKKKRRKPRRRRLKGKHGRGTAADDKPPVLGLIARNGLVRIWLLANVQRKITDPIIRQRVSEGSTLPTDEYYNIGFFECLYNLRNGVSWLFLVC